MSHVPVRIFPVKLIFVWMCSDTETKTFYRNISVSLTVMKQCYWLCDVLLKFLVSPSFIGDTTTPTKYGNPHLALFFLMSSAPTLRAAREQRSLFSAWHHQNKEGPFWLPGLQEASDAFTLDTSCTSCETSPPRKGFWKNEEEEECFYSTPFGFILARNPRLFLDEHWAHKKVVFQKANHLPLFHCERYWVTYLISISDQQYT